jgi:hypothetical protein
VTDIGLIVNLREARLIAENPESSPLPEGSHKSFGAFDPATLRQYPQTAINRASTLLVIAHP